jgi:uncharacterized GH25 family protein
MKGRGMRKCLTVILLALLATEANAHYNMLFPERPWAKKGERITFVYQWGHPFEHQLFDAPRPKRLLVITPDNKTENLADRLATFKQVGADGMAVTAWKFQFTPAERGDYTFLLVTPPLAVDDSKELVEDIVRVVLHVQAQKNWDTDEIGEHAPDVTLTPLTRPYGLLPGSVFQARFWQKSQLPFVTEGKYRPVERGAVEWERYNPRPVRDLPPDELITFRTKTDPRGVFTCTLAETGWWGMTAIHVTDDNRRQRATMWVHVDEKK